MHGRRVQTPGCCWKTFIAMVSLSYFKIKLQAQSESASLGTNAIVYMATPSDFSIKSLRSRRCENTVFTQINKHGCYKLYQSTWSIDPSTREPQALVPLTATLHQWKPGRSRCFLSNFWGVTTLSECHAPSMEHTGPQFPLAWTRQPNAGTYRLTQS